jgi:hypothetical protein
MLELTEDQRQQVKRANGEPIRLFDPETNRTFVLVPEEVYEKVKTLFAEEGAEHFAGDIYPHVMEVFGREGWDDPAMDVYNELDPRREA